jgi:hypothetical protein
MLNYAQARTCEEIMFPAWWWCEQRRLANPNRAGQDHTAGCLTLSSFAAIDPFLLLSTPAVTNGQLHFTLQTESGVSYVIEMSPDLQNWSPVITNSATNLTRLISLNTTTDPNYFRAWRQPLPVFAPHSRRNLTCT